MAEDIGKVSFGIEANFDDKGMKQAEQGLSGLQRAGNQAAKGISAFGVAAGTAGGIIGVELVKALGQAAIKVATFAFTVTESASAVVESFDKMAQATGVSVRHFQQLEPVMRKNGVSAEQMGATFRILARNIHEARDPSSQAGQAFESLGLSLTGLESPSEVLTLIAERVSKLPDGFEKTRLITELLGRSGSQLTSILNEGAAGFKRSAEEAAKMANVLSDDANKALLEVNDTFDMLDVAQDNLSKHLAVLFKPMVQAVNEARIAAVNLATVFTDELTIATRTLAVRLEALFGFLKAQAQLSITEIGKVPEIFERWNNWAEEQIVAIRKQSIATKDLGDAIGTVDAKAQALARSSALAAQQSSFGLQQVDIGWKIVQELIDAYRKSQETLGTYISTKLISAYQELQQASALWAKSDFDAANRNIDQMKAMEAQYRATADASNRAALASGGITPMQFEERSGASALAAIDREIAAQQQRIAASNAYYANELQRATDNSDKQRTLIQQHIADVATANNAIAVLEQQRVTQSITNISMIEQANQNATQVELAAKAGVARAELTLLQNSYASVEEINAAKLAVIDATLQAELANVQLTEEQKTVIYKRAEAERAGISRGFFDGWAAGMRQYMGDTASGFGMAADMARRTAQMMEQGFQTFFFDLMDGKIESLKDVFTGLLQFVKQIIAQVTAQLVAQQVLKYAMAGFAANLPSGAGSAANLPSGYSATSGFASGGSFRVGGSGGTDSQFVGFMASPDERVLIQTPAQQRGGMNGNAVINITINANGGGAQESSTGASTKWSQVARDLGKLVEAKLVEEQRPGGLLAGGRA